MNPPRDRIPTGALVVLDLGHVGRTGGNPPARSAALREDALVLAYVAHAYRVLVEAGCTVEIAGAGAYPARRRAARDAGASAYVACHVNAGTGVDYGCLLHSGEERAGALSRAVALTLRDGAPELRRIVTGAAGVGGWSVATLQLISGAGCPGLLFEPGSIDRPEHAPLWTPDGLRRVGEALARGVLAWLSP